MARVFDEVKSETAEMLAVEAEAQGLSVDEYLRSLLPRAHQPGPKALSVEQRSILWREWTARHSVKGIVADDSRESIYREREDGQL